MSTERPLLSLIIPAYNEAKPQRLPASLDAITAFVAQQDFAIEVIIVDNNSNDATPQIAAAAADAYPYIRVLTEIRQGKGAAVKTGMGAAEGEYLFICDADLSMPIEEVLKFLPPLVPECDIAIGSRAAPGAQRIDEPEYRHIMGRVFNGIVRVIAIGGIGDTQCGFKSFRRDVARDLFPHQTIDGWAFDVELLFIAQQRGYSIREIPITWIYKPQSKISPLRDALSMLTETLRIRWNGMRGLYQKSPDYTQAASQSFSGIESEQHS
ncbi:MAG: dolichyl-phosphate beta-glucosyltransferase [Aggregatilineales bacterium]